MAGTSEDRPMSRGDLLRHMAAVDVAMQRLERAKLSEGERAKRSEVLREQLDDLKKRLVA